MVSSENQRSARIVTWRLTPLVMAFVVALVLGWPIILRSPVDDAASLQHRFATVVTDYRFLLAFAVGLAIGYYDRHRRLARQHGSGR